MGAFLMALAGPLARQVLISLGFGLVTYVGVDTALAALVSHAKEAWGQNGSVSMAFLAMSGLNTGVGIVVGALTARVSMMQLKRLLPK